MLKEQVAGLRRISLKARIPHFGEHGYFDNHHPGTGRDWGTFEARVSTVGGGMIVEGTFKFVGGDGEYRGITGGGTFKSVMKSETELECTWEGNYELAKAKAS